MMDQATPTNVAPEFEASLKRFFDLALETARTMQGSTGGPKSLRDFADDLERTPEFLSLAKSVSTLDRSEALRGPTFADSIALGHFLKRSGVYFTLHSGKDASLSDIADRFKMLMLQSNVAITYLAPIELIELSEDHLTFDQFTIRRFSRNELEKMTQNTIRAAFYNSAALDLNTLADYWYLVVTETTPVQSAISFGASSPRVSLSYTGYPQVIETNLYPLVLCDWVDQYRQPKQGAGPAKREADDQLFLPHIPFVIALSENWLQFPGRAPATDEMLREPHFDEENGEEIGERPVVVFFFDDAKTKEFEENLKELSARLRLIQQHQPKWRFVYTALGFLTKAFRTEGVEQLLWHVTAIEAILGQKLDVGLTSTLKRRTAEVFGGEENERRDFKKQFERLYSFRSDLVHGNSELVDKNIMKGHLAESRDFARGVVAWATGFLAHVAATYPTGTHPIPTREDLLLLLDMTATTRNSVATVLESLPKGFPAIEDWLI